MINKCAGMENAPKGHRVAREMRLTAQIGDYEMDQVSLDLGSDVNIFPKQMWERMGRPVLHWSLIQLRMMNQKNIFTMGCLHEVTIDIEGASVLANFEVI